MPAGGEQAGIEGLRKRLDEEEAAYAGVLESLDRLASFSLPSEASPEVRERLASLNELWEAPHPPTGGGIAGWLGRRAWEAIAPALERQTRFNAALVQLLNAHLAPLEELHVRLRELAAALVHYAQRVQPLVDARSRLASAVATTHSELVLEALDRRLESLLVLRNRVEGLEGLLAMRDRVEAVSEEARAIRATLSSPPTPRVARKARQAAEDASYTAFENRFRGSREEIRDRLRGYVETFRDQAPLVDLGCGRGEFLEELRSIGVQAQGVEANANAVHECLEKGLDVIEGDLVDYLMDLADASLGGVFAAQVAEHLPPPALNALLREAHRVLRPGGLLALETVNPRSVIGFLEVYNRDLSHERPLHPETLAFLAAAAGFTDVRTELCSPVPPEGQLLPVPSEGLEKGTATVLNENVRRLNALVYGPMEYVLYARG